jgi:hypothetical protein
VRFSPEDATVLMRHLHFVLHNQRKLSLAKGAIHVTYEDLCQPKYQNGELDEFFGRPIALDDPRPPTHGSGYVQNWDDFTRFVEREAQRLQALPLL